jgi:hypothetical protein
MRECDGLGDQLVIVRVVLQRYLLSKRGQDGNVLASRSPVCQVVPGIAHNTSGSFHLRRLEPRGDILQTPFSLAPEHPREGRLCFVPFLLVKGRRGAVTR